MSSPINTFAAAIAAVSLVVLGACADEGRGSGTDAAVGRGVADAADAPFEVDGDVTATNRVTLPRSYKFEPAVITVKPGTAVTWENKDDFPHNVKLMGADTEVRDLRIGDAATIMFDQAGTFYYQCTLHPTQMRGKVIVE